MTDPFWDRKTTFWEEEEPRRSTPVAGPKAGSGESRRARRAQARSRRSKIATLCALASSTALLVVLLNGLVSSDAGRDANGGRAARASDGVHAPSPARFPTLGPLGNAVPVASVTDAPLGSAAPGSAAPSAAGPSQAPVGTGGSAGAPAPSASGASPPAPASESPPAPTPASPLAAPTTTPLPTQPPSCTIGLLGTCIVDRDGALLP